MSFLGRLFGSPTTQPAPPRRAALSADERMIERYRFLLRTAPAETLEQVHTEAFARLNDAQRAQIYTELSEGAGTGERPRSSEPATLARAATRAEFRQSGTLEAALRGPGPILGTVAAYVVGSALVSAFLPWDAAYEVDASPANTGELDFHVSDFGDFEF